MTRQPRVAVLIASDVPSACASQAHPHARQLLRWFERLPLDAQFEVHDLARCRHARLARPSFEVLPTDMLTTDWPAPGTPQHS